ncbi:PREDICTED: gastric triacylglycerol lipase-like [Cyphomyrmex costatus]|uniref:gastric triacylglycerol lipase-like n=1 Tax=Cyphomyrmex costatus TaxID=456900 RepID=UPI000852211E|nr:PREDICTED: gastric triacylglycerol lipase-like [Cyphomyrmex costatus]
MRIETKLISFTLLFSVMLMEAKLQIGEDFASFRKMLFHYLFPQDSHVVRVRKLEEIQTVNNVTTLDFIGLVERYGYPAEEHYVTTEDGYNLVIHRMSGNPLSISQKKKTVVFFLGGLFCSSDIWVLVGPNKDLAFLLADEGYDVWLGNYRGNTYCRSHVKLSPQNKEFWQFSHHEIGTRDLPAMIDYILNYTNQETMHSVSISMGGTVLFILLSMKPEYNAKIKLGICFAPIAIWKEVSPAMKYLSNMTPSLKEIFDSNEIYEILTLTSMGIKMARTLCVDNTITQAVCVAAIYLLAGYDPVQLNTTMMPTIFSNYPAGSSVQLVDHYFQNIIAKKFQAYDHGYFGNYKHYGQNTPIIYNLTKITAPMAIYYGNNDLIATKANTLEIYKHLPNVILLEENKLFNHFDFIIAINAKTLVFDGIIELLQKFNNDL